MRLIIRDDTEGASYYVANYIIQRIKHFNPSPAHPFVLGLPTGSSPLAVYRILVEKYKAGEVSLEMLYSSCTRLTLVCNRYHSKMSLPLTWSVNMHREQQCGGEYLTIVLQDEYIGIPRDHPESYHSFMWKNFFSHVNVKPSNVNILNGNAPNLEAECVEYEAKIRRAGGIDLFLGGIGEDGHIAFNEPGSSLASRTRVKTLAYDTIIANSRFFDNDLDKVPKMALTVGVQTVLEAREVVVIILGSRKASALQKCIEQGVNHMWTLSSLQLHPHPMIVCDEDATLELQVKTVKVGWLDHTGGRMPMLTQSRQYFKSIEQVAKQQGFEQILPSTIRTGPTPMPKPIVDIRAPPSPPSPTTQSPTILAPQPTTSRFLRPKSPANEYPIRSVSPDLVPDRMADRVGVPNLSMRLTPRPEQQQRFASVGA